MINGRLFDALTMNEITNGGDERISFYWERPGASDAFVWRGELHGFEFNGCGCFVEP